MTGDAASALGIIDAKISNHVGMDVVALYDANRAQKRHGGYRPGAGRKKQPVPNVVVAVELPDWLRAQIEATTGLLIHRGARRRGGRRRGRNEALPWLRAAGAARLNFAVPLEPLGVESGPSRTVRFAVPQPMADAITASGKTRTAWFVEAIRQHLATTTEIEVEEDFTVAGELAPPPVELIGLP